MSTRYIELCHYQIRQEKVPSPLLSSIKQTILMRLHKKIKIQRQPDPSIQVFSGKEEDRIFGNLQKKQNDEYQQSQKVTTKQHILKTFPFSSQVISCVIETEDSNNGPYLISENKHLDQQNQPKQIDEEMQLSHKETSLPSHLLPIKKLEPILKTKLIKKCRSGLLSEKNKARQKQIHKLYCRYLTNYLHLSNRIQIEKNIPPKLSVLETIDDGDYMQDFTRKDYPHFSNTIQLTEIPPCYGAHKSVQIIKEPIKLSSAWSKQRDEIRDHDMCSQEDIIVFKFKHIVLFIESLFKNSIEYHRNIRLIKNTRECTGNKSIVIPKVENQDYPFEKIGARLSLSVKCCKLMFDLLNNYFLLEKELDSTETGINQESKETAMIQIKQLLNSEVKKVFKESVEKDSAVLMLSHFVPIEQRYLSLRELRMLLLELYSSQSILQKGKNQKLSEKLSNIE